MDCANVGELKKNKQGWPPISEDLQKGWISDVLWEPSYLSPEDQEITHLYMTQMNFSKIEEYEFSDRKGKDWLLKRYEFDESKRNSTPIMCSHFRNLLYPIT